MTAPQTPAEPSNAAEPESKLRSIRPSIALPRDRIPLPLAVGIGLTLAMGLFLLLNSKRRASEAPAAAARLVSLPPAPELIIPQPQQVIAMPPAMAEAGPRMADSEPPRPKPPAIPPQMGIQFPLPQAPQPYMPYTPPVTEQQPAVSGSSRPALVLDLSPSSGAAVNAGVAASPDSEAQVATRIRNTSTVIPQGTMIPAVLETPLNSDRPGPARAIVSRDIRSFDGTRVLIGRGSRLVGEFKADGSRYQKRVLVTWNRLIRPDGVVIRLLSPVTDSLGGTGAAGSVNNHFFERFASAIFQSVLTVGVNAASQSMAKAGSVYVGLPGATGQIGQQLLPDVTRPATIKVAGGSEVAIFVARDLDFRGTPPVR